MTAHELFPHLPYVCTIINGLGNQKLTENAIRLSLAAILGKDGADNAPILWLNDGVAADIFMPTHPDKQAAHVLAAAYVEPVDVIFQARSVRDKKLLVSDMDSTLIEQECIDELADALGLKAQISAITERAMRGELEFASALKERVALLKGLPASEIDDVLSRRITLMPGAAIMAATLKQRGIYQVIVSGGFTPFTQAVRQWLGFDADVSNQLGITNQQLDGTVKEPIFGADGKRDTLLRLMQERGLSPDDAIAIGDGANDLPMLLEAGLGIAYHAKPAVQAAARNAINHHDLTGLLYALGINKADWAQP